ncbi:MAG: hypothetical protein A2Y20_09085 [Firmicutes bacterium GWF2_51_9]|nr:MAG: hypothetical protein A2Y20_09085 [Firmicutes bacterium GWF2_51_9]OGS58075.1 MAG: hypothetical protein A2Y19_05930 [Firmicutes bacterium GWE2_51_13]HBZ41283.1 hypothetical protein [Erysipelotrichaceae bacterium]
MDYRLNLRKVGVMIRHYRNQRLSLPEKENYSQDAFLITSTKHAFFELLPGYPVCSRATLSRIENGKDIYEEELYRFFLRKLDLTYRYSIHAELQYEACFQAIDKILLHGKSDEFMSFAMPGRHPDNVLYSFYDDLIQDARTFFMMGRFPSLEALNRVKELWYCVPHPLKPALRFIFVLARVVHPFYDRIELDPVFDCTMKHPLNALVVAMISISDHRFALCQRILKRFEDDPQHGELISLIVSHMRMYFSVATLKQKHGFPMIDSVVHPFDRLILASFLLRLGKDAVDRRDFDEAFGYFESLRGFDEPLCVFSAIVTGNTCHRDELVNPKLKVIQTYLNQVRFREASLRLDFLLSEMPPILGEADRFMKICFKREILGLVSETRRYKSLYDYIIKTETL